MSEQSWDVNPDRLRTSPQQIAEVEAQIRAVPPDQRSTYQLQQRGIVIPPGYRLEPNGRLKYVAVNNEEHWYNNAKIMLPLIASAGLTYGATAGPSAAGGAAAGAAGGGAAAGSGAAASSIPTLASSAIGSGMGYGPASLAGTSALAGGGAAASAIPTIASRTIGNGMSDGYGVADLPSQTFDLGSGSDLLNRVGRGAKDALTGDGDEAPAWLKALMAGMAGLPGLLGNNGPSDEERAYGAQATRLLRQQEQRTQFQNPLYEATTRMAYGLLPNMGNNGQAYPMNSLEDAKVPTLEDLIASQRRS